MTLGEAIERYVKAKSRKKSLKHDQLYLNQLAEVFGTGTLLVETTAAKITAWRDDRLSATCGRTKRKFSPAGVNRPLAALRHLLTLAATEWETIPKEPKFKLAKEAEGRIRWLEPHEEQALLSACEKSTNQELRPIVVVALETGLRLGELLGLTWGQLDMTRGVIRLEITKSGRRREVPMRQVVYDTFAGLSGKRDGRVWKTRCIRHSWEKAVEKAGLENVHFHDCRHHFASWYVMRGGSTYALQKLLGHSTQP